MLSSPCPQKQPIVLSKNSSLRAAKSRSFFGAECEIDSESWAAVPQDSVSGPLGVTTRPPAARASGPETSIHDNTANAPTCDGDMLTGFTCGSCPCVRRRAQSPLTRTHGMTDTNIPDIKSLNPDFHAAEAAQARALRALMRYRSLPGRCRAARNRSGST